MKKSILIPGIFVMLTLQTSCQSARYKNYLNDNFAKGKVSDELLKAAHSTTLSKEAAMA